ncbi:O-antigen ligase family protein [Enterovibrio sp. ZSDZ35]|uniref:O-antigen ligase family protein n=1 Tax=Enterovibrio qingdaonensis TaxID=2899818 RepID=A0ABT5QNB7_9GAMM|nr:O-antigen ligase family protein [Enterovibrio sp. ZSDZ35]MDD1782178.1 O-antigen ligase family protein [Enterovibrio sp. ZSDZ35]
MARSIEHLAAFAVILFFIPWRVSIANVDLYLADLLGIASIGLLAITTLRGRLLRSTITASTFIIVFVLYIFLSGLYNNVPAKLILIEMVQWLSIAAFLGVLHQENLLASPRFLSLVALYAFGGACYTAAWHLSHPEFNDFKHLENTKYFFGFCFAMLYVMRHQIRFSHLFLFIALVLLLMSGERKAMFGVAAILLADYLFCRPIPAQQQDNLQAMLMFFLAGVALAAFSSWYIWGIQPFLDAIEFNRYDVLFADQNEAQWNSELWRKLLLANGFELFLSHPWIGVGPKMLPDYLAPFFLNPNLAIYTHNFVLDVAIEYGTVGLVILIGGFLRGARRLYRQRAQNPVAFLLAVYILAMVLFVAVNSTIMLMFLLPFFVNTRVETLSPVPPKAAFIKTTVTVHRPHIKPRRSHDS